MIRLREGEHKDVESIAQQEDISEAEVARRLLLPAITLAKRFGFQEVAAELRQHAQKALGLSHTTLSRKVARAKAKLPLKASPKSGGAKMRFG